VVRLAREDLVPAIQLLEQHDPRELVRKRQLSERQAVLDVVELQAERASDHEAQIEPALAPLLQEATESNRIHPLAGSVEQRHEGPFRQPPRDVPVLSHLDQLQPRVAREQLLIMVDIVGERGALPPHGDDDDPHDGILRVNGSEQSA